MMIFTLDDDLNKAARLLGYPDARAIHNARDLERAGVIAAALINAYYAGHRDGITETHARHLKILDQVFLEGGGTDDKLPEGAPRD